MAQVSPSYRTKFYSACNDADFKAQASLYTRTLLLARLGSLHLSLVTAENPDGLCDKDAFGNYPWTDVISFSKLFKLNFTGSYEIIRLRELLLGLFNETRLIAPFVPRCAASTREQFYSLRTSSLALSGWKEANLDHPGHPERSIRKEIFALEIFPRRIDNHWSALATAG